MKPIAYLLIAVTVGTIAYLGTGGFDVSSQNSPSSTQSQYPFGQHNDTIAWIVNYSNHTDYGLNPINLLENGPITLTAQISVNGSCGLTVNQQISFTFSSLTGVGGTPYAPMIVVLQPQNCQVYATGWSAFSDHPFLSFSSSLF